VNECYIMRSFFFSKQMNGVQIVVYQRGDAKAFAKSVLEGLCQYV